MNCFFTLVLLSIVASVALAQTDYRPSTSKSKDCKYFKDGKINIIPSSHQDIAWMDSIGACEIWRDEKMLTPVLSIMERNPKFCFSCEDGMQLMEYLKRHPERYGEILKYTKEGRLEWGATYNNPYESMYDGEALIRQVYVGKKCLQKTLPGCEFKSAFNEDVPGRAMQMPQILSKAGVDYLMFSRHEPGIYKWFSPDGSFVLGFTPGQYYMASYPMGEAKNDSLCKIEFVKYACQWNNYFRENRINPYLPFLYSLDWSEPKEFKTMMEDWNKRKVKENLPELTFSTVTDALKSIQKNTQSKFESITGERPEVWLYIHGPTHEHALTASRKANRMLVAAEKFSSVSSVIAGNFETYPQQKFADAWKDAIYADHGWGGVWGHLTDLTFRKKFEYALTTATHVADNSMKALVSKINFSKKDLAIVVFNSLSWERTDEVKVSIDPYGQKVTTYKILDSQTGSEVPSQQIAPAPGNGVEPVTITFIAENVPSLGYKTYYAVPFMEESRFVTDKNSTKYWMNPTQPTHPSTVGASANSGSYENGFYKVVFAKGGIKSIYDKQLQKELLSANGLLGGEVFQLESVGNGAGEFTDIQPVSMGGFEKISQYAPNWNCCEFGDVKKSWEFTQQTKFATVREKISLYDKVKKIDFEIDILGFSGEHYREYRVAFPLDQSHSTIAYEVPMGVVEVGKNEIKGAAGFSYKTQIYNTPCSEVHPREVQDWFNASENNVAVNISSSVAVFDWVDPTDKANKNAVLQPILLASRRSCHGEGNFYLQPGNHHYLFSFTSGEGDWKNFVHSGKQQNMPLLPVTAKPQKVENGLPETMGFVNVDAKNIIVSAIKKADDENNLIVRLYETSGLNTDVTVVFIKPIKGLWKTNIIEENPENVDIQGNSFKVKIGHNAIETFKVQF